MNKRNFIIIAVLILVTTVGLYLAWYQKSQRKSENALQSLPSSKNETPSTPSVTTKPATGQYFISQKVSNSNGALVFYFRSDHDISTLNPFSDDACFNGDTKYFIWNKGNKFTREYLQSIQQVELIPTIFDSKNSQGKTINVLGDERAPNGCSKIIRWANDNILLEKVSFGDLSASSKFFVVDIANENKIEVGSWTVGSPEIIGEFGEKMEVDKSGTAKGEILINELKGIFAQQYCFEEERCHDISLYLGALDNKGNLVTRLGTTKRMKLLDLSSEFNTKNLNKKVRLDVGDNGYFILDLEKYRVIESKI